MVSKLCAITNHKETMLGIGPRLARSKTHNNVWTYRGGSYLTVYSWPLTTFHYSEHFSSTLALKFILEFSLKTKCRLCPVQLKVLGAPAEAQVEMLTRRMAAFHSGDAAPGVWCCAGSLTWRRWDTRWSYPHLCFPLLFKCLEKTGRFQTPVSASFPPPAHIVPAPDALLTFDLFFLSPVILPSHRDLHVCREYKEKSSFLASQRR